MTEVYNTVVREGEEQVMKKSDHGLVYVGLMEAGEQNRWEGKMDGRCKCVTIDSKMRNSPLHKLMQ
jgi:hypothetical protein